MHTASVMSGMSPGMSHSKMFASSSLKSQSQSQSIEDTIYALSTGGGASATAVAVIRITGPQSHEALRILLSKTNNIDEAQTIKLPRPRYASLRMLYDPIIQNPPPTTTTTDQNQQRDPLDSSLVLLFQNPSSFTGQDMVELHTHGSRAVVQGVLNALSLLSTPPYNLSIRPADRGEFTQSAYANGKLGLLEVEALADLIVADTSTQRLQALRQMDGRLSGLYEGWRGDLIKGLAHAEAVIDFGDDEDLDPGLEGMGDDGEDDGVGEMAIWGAIPPRMADLRGRMEKHLSDAERGEILRDGVKVAIIGPPNAGKSSLLNILANRDAAIVSPIAGTTRDVIEVAMDLGGVRCIVSDTAGVREEGSTGDVIEVEGMRRAIRVAADAHVLVCMVDALDEDRGISVVKEVLDGIEEKDQHVLFLYNKVDLLDTAAPVVNDPPVSKLDSSEPRDNFLNLAKAEKYSISCETSDGVDMFVKALTKRVYNRVMVPSDSDSNSDKHAIVDDGAVITRARHRTHVQATLQALQRFEVLSGQGYMALDMAAEELRLAGSELGRITGAVDVEDVLDVLFADFCIGK